MTEELEAYSPTVAAKPRMCVATKIDALDDPGRLQELKEFCARAGLSCHAISAATGGGVPELLRAIEARLQELTGREAASAEGRLDPVASG